MSLSRPLQLLTAILSIAAACPSIQRRQEDGNTSVPVPERYWAYEQSFDWGRQNPDWELCQTGTQQSPIPLRSDQGLSRNHLITFDYPDEIKGELYNWGYGPAYALDHKDDDWTSLPSITFEEDNKNETVYLGSWHIHAPADHTVQGDRSKAELHLVHHTADGKARAVLGFRIDPGNSDSKFFSQLPAMVHFNETEKRLPDVSINPNEALNEVNGFSDFWTYKGSLTSPPCTEGKRWFVARNILWVSDKQMQDILRVSTYSARTEQEVWAHEINV